MRQISVVIPLYNEQDNVIKLYNELCDVAAASGDMPYEFIFVDDGSSDQTIATLTEASKGDNRVAIVCFRRNFGQTAAMAAGLDMAQGDIVVTMDGDLQNDPKEIPGMIAKLETGYDLVAGWRKDRQDAMVSRKIPSMFANKLISKITGVHLHDYGCTLKAMRAEVAKRIQLYGEMHRFIPALAAELGAKIAEVPVNHRPRVHGTSKYGISRTFRVLCDLLTVKFFLGFSTRPLHMFGGWGLISGFIGMALLAYLTFEKFAFGSPMGSRPALMLGALLVIISVQFVCFGLLAEMLVRTYHESQNKKIYTVRNTIYPGKLILDNSEKKVVGGGVGR